MATEGVIIEPGDNYGACMGLCPAADLPAGYTGLTDYTDETSANFATYKRQIIPSGWGGELEANCSIRSFIPKFYYKWTGNSISIKGIDTYFTTALANADGYVLDRAFLDGGYEKSGVFVDRYVNTHNSYASYVWGQSKEEGTHISINGSWMSNALGIENLTACPSDDPYQVINAARYLRTFVTTDESFSSSIFIYAMLARLAQAQAQAATGTTYCAWWSSGDYNYPKGSNDNYSYQDTDDSSVTFSSAGAHLPTANIAKTTHNGQLCGIHGLNGYVWEYAIGMTSIVGEKSFTEATRANPCILTVASHGRITGDYVEIDDGGTSELNQKVFKITVVDEDRVSLDNCDSSSFSPAGPGTAKFGRFYVARPQAAMKDYTAGNSLATDHWGEAGVSATMELFDPTIETVYPDNNHIYSENFGNSTNAVFSGSLTGNEYLTDSLGMPKDTAAMSSAGTAAFGTDAYSIRIWEDIFPRVGGSFQGGSGSGIWSKTIGLGRLDSAYDCGYRCAEYPAGGIAIPLTVVAEPFVSTAALFGSTSISGATPTMTSTGALSALTPGLFLVPKAFAGISSLYARVPIAMAMELETMGVNFVVRFAFILTGAPNSLPDAVIPISSMSCNLRSDDPSYAQVVAPYSPATAELIIDRPDGEIVIRMMLLRQGETLRDYELARVRFDRLSLYPDVNPQTIILSGHQVKTYTGKEITIDTATGMVFNDELLSSAGFAAIDAGLLPGDTLTVLGSEMTVGVVNIEATASDGGNITMKMEAAI